MAWHNDPSLVRNLGTALTNANLFNTPGDVTDYHNKPHRYRDYYNAWSSAGFPEDDTEPGWDEFVDEVTNFGEDEDDDDDEDDTDDEKVSSDESETDSENE